jgi:SAM-dependent MidA family methyltransferase
VSQPTPLESLLLERIAERGPMPFAAFMQLALYHPHFGYYSAAEPRTDWSGHFVTSSEIDPAYGQLWTRAFEEIWMACGSPSDFEVVEIGPGEGGFAEAVLGCAEGAFAKALRYRMVERNPRLQERQRARLKAWQNVTWSNSAIEVRDLPTGVVFANEVLDNLPVHLVEKHAGALWEVCVTGKDGKLAFVRLPPSSPELERFLQRVDINLPEGHRVEVSLAAESIVMRLASVIGIGALFFVDYGKEASALELLPQGSLVSYSAAGADDDILARPGTKDITSHANWGAVRSAAKAQGLDVIGPLPQHEVLQKLGLRELDRMLRLRYQRELDARNGAGAVEALSRRQALGALSDDSGLGGLGVLACLKGIEAPPFVNA